MTKEEALHFINKWSEVEKIHIEEVRALSYAERLQQIDNLYQFATVTSNINAESLEETLAPFENINQLKDMHAR